MPKRVGHVWEKLTSVEHCNAAVLRAIKRKRKTRYLKYVRENHEKFGARTRKLLLDGWEPDPVRIKTINEGTSQKTRDLKIPSLRDHLVHTAVAMILEEHLAKRFGFYVCGSLPNRGQTFAVKAVEARIRKKRPKYCNVSLKRCRRLISDADKKRLLHRRAGTVHC